MDPNADTQARQADLKLNKLDERSIGSDRGQAAMWVVPLPHLAAGKYSGNSDYIMYSIY